MDNNIFQSQFQERKWLKQHGKKQFIRFEDNDLKELRKYFSSLDVENKGCIGVRELEEPLIALGLAQNREDVIKLIKYVDQDGNQTIEFEEFLALMIKNNSKRNSQPIYLFFKKMIQKELNDDMHNDLPFRLNVSQFRRKKILDAIMSGKQEKKEQGQKILNAYKQQLKLKKQERNQARGDSINDISLDKVPNNEHVNTRNGFTKRPRIMAYSQNNLLQLKQTSQLPNIKKK